MPNYSYVCQACLNEFELFYYIKDYQSEPKCPRCNKYQTHRMLILDVSTQSHSVKKSDNELKTVGDLANRNRDRLSEDEKRHLYKKHNAYKEDSSEKTLPKGMTRIKKTSKRNK